MRPSRLVLANVMGAVEDQDAAAIEFLQQHAAGMGLVALEFYSGLGGFAYGLAAACPGSRVAAAFEINDVANDVYQHNHGVRPRQVGCPCGLLVLFILLLLLLLPVSSRCAPPPHPYLVYRFQASCLHSMTSTSNHLESCCAPTTNNHPRPCPAPGEPGVGDPPAAGPLPG